MQSKIQQTTTSSSPLQSRATAQSLNPPAYGLDFVDRQHMGSGRVVQAVFEKPTLKQNTNTPVVQRNRIAADRSHTDKQKWTAQENAANYYLMKQYIEGAKDQYLGANYQQAYDLLVDAAQLNTFGYDLDRPKFSSARGRIYISDQTTADQLWNTIEERVVYSTPITRSARSYPDKGSITLPEVDVRRRTMAGAVPVSERDMVADFPEVAKLLLPIYFEEWMHALQYNKRQVIGISENPYDTGAFISQNTQDYYQVTNENPQGANYNEIDILATFQDWGFDAQTLNTTRDRDRTPEGDGDMYGRKAFDQWKQAQ